MDISIVHDNEEENEISVGYCCDYCLKNNHSLTTFQLSELKQWICGTKVVNVPFQVKDEKSLIQFLKNK